MTSSTTARIAREARGAECARVLRRLLAEHDVSQTKLARLTGARRDKVQRWCDPDSPQSPRLHDILAMPDPVAIGMLRWFSREFGHSVVPVDVGMQSLQTRISSVIREHGEAMSAITASLATPGVDGHPMSDAELRTALKEVPEASAETVRLQMELEQEAKRRGLR